METYTVGQLAREADVNIETIRYYERRGLLRQTPRTDAGYRQYSESDLWSLQFIARAKQLGFRLAEIATMTGSDGSNSAEDVLLMARAKIEELDEARKALAETSARLERLVAICAEPDSDDCRALRLTS